MQVDFDFDRREWDELFAAWEEPAVKKTLRSAASAYGKAGKPILKGRAPRATGDLQSSVRFKRMRARTGAIGVVVAPMGKKAAHRNMVELGTKPHLILPRTPGGRIRTLFGFVSVVNHPGARANPWVAASADAVEDAGSMAAEEVIFDGLDARPVPPETDG